MKIKLGKIKKIFKNIPQIVAQKAFLFSIIFILMALLTGAALFYKYDALVERQELPAGQSTLNLKQEIYLSILTQWQSRQEKFNVADFKNWPDPFSSSLTK
jgi:hypothetical protein